MKNSLLKFLFKAKKCTHKNALPASNEGYCPDCGKYLKKNYYLVRCSCCDIKMDAKVVWGEIMPVNKYCPNCGTGEFYIEKLDSINLVDANYAVCINEETEFDAQNSPEIQIWVDNSGKQKQIPLKSMQAN